MNLNIIKGYFTLSILLGSICTAFAQDIYQDLEGNIVSERKYYRKANNNEFYRFNEVINDTTFHTLLIREREGRLSKSENDTLWAELEQNDPNGLVDIDYVIVSYLHGIKKCGGSWTIESYLNRLNPVKIELDKIGKSDFLYYHYGNEELERQRQKGHYNKDRNGYIANLFLEAQVYCSSYIVINRDGFYQSFLGEMEIEHLIQMVLDIYSFEEEITKVGGKPVTIVEIQHRDPSGALLSRKKYSKMKKKGEYNESVEVIDNIKIFSLIEKD